jgi:hypothetical protein
LKRRGRNRKRLQTFHHREHRGEKKSTEEEREKDDE